MMRKREHNPPVSPLFDEALIACVAEDFGPTIQELHAVAARIWTEGACDRSNFDWNNLPTQSVERLRGLGAAQLALCGDPFA